MSDCDKAFYAGFVTKFIPRLGKVVSFEGEHPLKIHVPLPKRLKEIYNMKPINFEGIPLTHEEIRKIEEARRILNDPRVRNFVLTEINVSVESRLPLYE